MQITPQSVHYIQNNRRLQGRAKNPVESVHFSGLFTKALAPQAIVTVPDDLETGKQLTQLLNQVLSSGPLTRWYHVALFNATYRSVYLNSSVKLSKQLPKNLANKISQGQVLDKQEQKIVNAWAQETQSNQPVIQLPESSLSRPLNLRNLQLHHAVLEGPSLRAADFTNTNLESAIFRVTDLIQANFTKANLESVDFSGADMDEANLSGANMPSVILKGTKKLWSAKITGAQYFWRTSVSENVQTFFPFPLYAVWHPSPVNNRPGSLRVAVPLPTDPLFIPATGLRREWKGAHDPDKPDLSIDNDPVVLELEALEKALQTNQKNLPPAEIIIR